MAEKLLEVKNLRTEFKRDKTWVTAVNNVSFSIQPGEILGLQDLHRVYMQTSE